MDHYKFCWKVMLLPPAFGLQLILFCLLYHLSDWLPALIVSAASGWAIGALGIECTVIRYLLHWYLQLFVPSEDAARPPSLPDNAEIFISAFDTFQKAAAKNVLFRLLGTAVKIAAFVVPFIAFSVHDEVFVAGIETPVARIEFAALAGTVLLILVAHRKLSRYARPSYIVVALLSTTLFWGFSYISKPGRGEVIHVVAVWSMSFLALWYDVSAFRSMRKVRESPVGHHSAKDSREMLELCVSVDLPALLGCSSAFLYWYITREDIGQGISQGFLAGAIATQFLTTVPSFFFVSDRVVHDD